MQDVRDNNDIQASKDIAMKLKNMQQSLDFYVENPYTNRGDKKTMKAKTY